MRKYNFLIFSLIFSLFFSCSSSLFLSSSKGSTVFLKESFLENYTPYDSLFLKYHVIWQKEENKKNLQANLALEKDQKSIVTLQKSGFQILKAFFSKEKLQIVQYLSEEFFEDSKIENYGIQQKDIEYLFLARIDTTLIEKIFFDHIQQFFLLIENKKIFGTEVEKITYIHPKTYLIKRIVFQSEEFLGTLEYEYPKKNKKDMFLPQRLYFRFRNGLIWKEINIRLHNIQTSPNPNRFNLKVPANYQKIDQIANLFQNG